MEVKIGVADTGRELVLNSASEPEEIEAKVAQALTESSGTLVLVDDKGKRTIVPSARIAYVEITPSDIRRVGFGS